MEWEVEFTEEFELWWDGLDEQEQNDVNAAIVLLRRRGVGLGSHTAPA